MKLNLLQEYPELCKEWEDKDFSPQMFTRGCTKKVKWKCKICKHIWVTRIQHRTNGHGCPKCEENNRKNKIIPKNESLGFNFPNLVCEWSRNNKKTIYEIKSHSNKNYEWQCIKCTNFWNTSPNARTLKKRGCPYCSGRKFMPGFSLLDTHPELCKEWYEQNKIKPFEISKGCNKKVKWKCKTCENIWLATINNRTQGRNCPKCCWKNTKPQKQVANYLLKNNISFEQEFRFTDCKNLLPLPFDFALFNGNNELKGLIEYQGIQHYKNIWGIKKFERTKINDNIKKEYCKNKNIPLLHINYQNDDIENSIWEFITNLY